MGSLSGLDVTNAMMAGGLVAAALGVILVFVGMGVTAGAKAPHDALSEQINAYGASGAAHRSQKQKEPSLPAVEKTVLLTGWKLMSLTAQMFMSFAPGLLVGSSSRWQRKEKFRLVWGQP